MLRNLPSAGAPVWIEPGQRRRADFSFLNGRFGFFAPRAKDIVPVGHCPALTAPLNEILPLVAKMPWTGSGGVLITECENGIAVDVGSITSYFSAEFKKAADISPIIRITWNNKIVRQSAEPRVKFGDIAVDYPPNAFLQPGKTGENALRALVAKSARDANKAADLFCGLGNFTFALGAAHVDGFDIAGGIRRDLFKKPLTARELRKYDCVVMDPPRAGAMAQSKELAKSDVRRVVYVSCSPETFMRDSGILTRGGYELSALTPVDQFVGSMHWELVGVFDKLKIINSQFA